MYKDVEVSSRRQMTKVPAHTYWLQRDKGQGVRDEDKGWGGVQWGRKGTDKKDGDQTKERERGICHRGTKDCLWIEKKQT